MVDYLFQASLACMDKLGTKVVRGAGGTSARSDDCFSAAILRLHVFLPTAKSTGLLLVLAFDKKQIWIFSCLLFTCPT